MLDSDGGSACSDSAPMMAAPGAMISGLSTPVRVGPALENQHGSPSTASLTWPSGSGAPPIASSAGTASAMPIPFTLSHFFLLIVQPTPMIAAFVAGRLIVLSRTACAKPTSRTPGTDASSVPCTYRSAVPEPARVTA
jgi:hypothetical protein